MAENPHILITFPTGHRLLCMQMRTSVGCFGFTVRAGSRYEFTPRTHGLAHFVEHTIFKGTAKRHSWHINSRMEAVGGELNAFTTKEDITFYTVFPKGNLARGAELLADLASSPSFPEKELMKEREVVREEISSYLDSPAELVFDEFENHIFAGSTLGHSILGVEDNLDGFTQQVCREFVNRMFIPSRMLLFYGGPESPATAAAIISRHFEKAFGGSDFAEDLSAGITARTANEKFALSRDTGAHQAHTVIGAEVAANNPAWRPALALLTNIIGGPGMNSLLNTELRERRGLVYSADASLAQLSDGGLFTIYFGCALEDRDRCEEIISRLVNDLQTIPLSERRLSAAKKQYLGQLVVAGASTEQTILSAANTVLRTDVLQSSAALRAEIENISSDDIMRAAAQIASMSRLTLC
ncbi:MAG: insulinase family protein [Bacteroidales bacterium]|nr:insulinase family protein [Bacteroidales bacterium]